MLGLFVVILFTAWLSFSFKEKALVLAKLTTRDVFLAGSNTLKILHSFVHLCFIFFFLCGWELREYNGQISNCICGVTHLCAGLAGNQLSLS